MTDSETAFYIGVDVGTGSARAAILDKSGKIIATATHNTSTFRSPVNSVIFEQSTNDIWLKISACVKDVLIKSQISPSHIKGVGFDATCSLAVTDLNAKPVSISNDEGCGLGNYGERNIILWADHRAEEEASFINSTGSEVLDFVGGTMSVSKLLVERTSYLTVPTDFIAGNGNTKNSMAQETYAGGALFEVPIFRSTGLP